jgi:superfamily II DNA or RNA helicase
LNAVASLFDDPATRWAPPAPDARRARAYQAAALEAWQAQRETARGHLMVLFTGGGKTFLAGQIAKAERGRVLFVVNRDTLGKQSIASLERDTGQSWQMEQADQWAHINSDANVVTLIQTLMQPRRFERFGPDAFSLIIVDEVHRMMAPRFRKPLEFFTGAKLLGLTATPDGAKKGFKPLLTNVVFNMPLAHAQRDAWSVPFDFQPYEVDVNLDALGFREGDFAQGELDTAMAEVAAPIARAAIEKCGDLRTLVFCPGVKAVVAAADAINKLRPGSARPLYGILDDSAGKGTKARNIADHKAGAFQFLVSCDMVREGYDDELVSCLLIARPMAKRYDFEQIVGRGSRLWPGVGSVDDTDERRAAIATSPKPMCRVIDLSCVSLKHALVGPVDVLGGDYTDKERERAKKILKAAGGGDPMKALDKARAEIARRKALAEAAAKAKVELRRVEAGERLTTDGVPAITEGQERKLTEFGVPVDRNMTKKQAHKALGFEFLCRKRGWCDYRQRNFLQTWVGVYDARSMPVEAGKALVEAWKANGRMRLSQQQIADALIK